MSKLKENPDSRFLHAEDLIHEGEWKQWTLTIEAVYKPGELTYKQGNSEKQIEYPSIQFAQGKKRILVLTSACNRRLMPYATGSSKPDEWVGRNVTVYAASGNWLGEQGVAAIRIRPKGNARPKLSPRDLGTDLTGTKVVTAVEEA